MKQEISLPVLAVPFVKNTSSSYSSECSIFQNSLTFIKLISDQSLHTTHTHNNPFVHLIGTKAYLYSPALQSVGNINRFNRYNGRQEGNLGSQRPSYRIGKREPDQNSREVGSVQVNRGAAAGSHHNGTLPQSSQIALIETKAG